MRTGETKHLLRIPFTDSLPQSYTSDQARSFPREL
jgi:hypothetical protein